MAGRDLLGQLQRTLGDGYTVERELARGGMSRVYLAKEKSLDRDVVVKALSPDLAADVNFERFSREIRLAGRLQHPHIVPLLSAGDSDGTPFYVMPFVEGESLRQRLLRTGELPVDETLRILRDVATALEYAHRQGIVHRDIKPENILLSGGAAVVTDFGVAKAISAATAGESASGLTTAGVALGTPAYMAPEQASADPSTDQRADIYAWGVIAYEMLTGAPPFSGRSTQATIVAHLAEPVPEIHRVGTPPRLTQLVMRALAKRPADRPQSAQELVLELDALASTGITPVEGTPLKKNGRGLRALAWVGGALAVAAIAFIVARERHTPFPSGFSTSGAKRIAVLPFANESGTRGDDYFADGMSEELGSALGKVRGVQVASHSSAFSFKGKDIDVKEVGRKLEVDAVLEGTVRRAANRLRVTAELTDVSNGLSLWSDSYERDSKDVFAVQDDIARAIAAALEVRFAAAPSNGGQRDVQGTADPEAYDLFLRGRYFWHKRGGDNLKRSMEFFRAAGARDPKFARAFAGLASAEVLYTEYADSAPRALNDSALAAADKALTLDPTVSEAYIARGLVDVHRWKWDDARNAYRTAIQLDPTSATAHQWLGELYYTLGQMDSSIVEMRRAKALDPLAPVPAIALSYALFGARRFAESVREAERARELAPELGLIARVLALGYLQLGDSAKARAAARKTIELEPGQATALAVFAIVAARTGHRSEALETLAALKGRHAAPMSILMADLGLGQTADALSELRKLVEARDPAFTQNPLVDPIFDPIRGTEGFRQAAEAIGTPDVLSRR
jgi:eukaryotic-like serine/threonine-protein kinase